MNHDEVANKRVTHCVDKARKYGRVVLESMSCVVEHQAEHQAVSAESQFSLH